MMYEVSLSPNPAILGLETVRAEALNYFVYCISICYLLSYIGEERGARVRKRSFFFFGDYGKSLGLWISVGGGGAGVDEKQT
jgi:hypothetical protein